MLRTILSVLAVLPLACGGDHHAADPASTPISPVIADAVYVVNGADSSITVIDATTDEVVGTIELADAPFPHHLYLSADRAEMFLAIPGADLSEGHAAGGHGDANHAFVMRLDAATGETLAVASLGASNHNAIPSPDGEVVWTSQMSESGTVLLLDATTLEELDAIDVGALPAEVTFSVDGPTAFVANSGAATVTAIDVASRAVLATLDVGDTPVGAWPARDGLLYVDNEVGRSISAIDPSVPEVTRTYDLDFAPAYAAVVDDELWVTDPAGGRVARFDLASGDELASVSTGAGAHALLLAPDGTRAWVSNQDDDSVSVVDVASRDVVATVGVGTAPNGLAFREAP